MTPHIEINADVAMSTGKTSAQVAHALGAWLLAQPLSTRLPWASDPGIHIGEVGFAAYAAEESDDASIITILDHGLTEIAPGTATVRVYLDLLV
ncbi:hypothetical protein E3T40_15450 [Cryobacterium sp. TMT1-19]|uniref:hypothetical protein n=1 Tax=unclassified Cryobacterium TaxID=2649013 RepID=UPI000CE41E56|nr:MULTISPECIES: hypothetical protein [unclassified Cryobacterium]TFD30386.1 hypothetical protein E3T40_15450 [Cryobacterium sp. TMT1-19]